MSDEIITTQKTETFVVYGGHYWGMGINVEEAKKVFRGQGGKLSNGYAVLTFDGETEFHGVDQMGRYHYKGNRPFEQVFIKSGKVKNTYENKDFDDLAHLIGSMLGLPGFYKDTSSDLDRHIDLVNMGLDLGYLTQWPNGFSQPAELAATPKGRSWIGTV